jgi:hypothetical protein
MENVKYREMGLRRGRRIKLEWILEKTFTIFYKRPVKVENFPSAG